MSAKEALKPKVGSTKKEEKRKQKKEKLTQELAAKEEAKAEMRKQEELEKKQAQVEQVPEAQATMGSAFAELVTKIALEGSQKEADPRRSQKKSKHNAIQNAKAMIASAAFQSNPEMAFSVINAQLQHKIPK
ncbi:TolA, putative [Trichomonas vaginalis G3]|uniref:TolA, putative n=1 Tax=Trichomonas vaginalis (strain ATCC PRA-98 / G3) TaxID=412133 RepID=A2DAR1_TRIV3|nr:hypothetical protein TVAGG3_0812320 [Trichomonas vaginalis G3]XP_001583558.1 hypothetical protein TVAGG3_0812420 [Trichomonas vaginalis G3]EAY22564.1 TolA, putative [Trichomonas vaginalis G3]EAY22572.1 TolA, putative [Trichomonas vaginalis G3]KAI5497296.1 hypothetical protein TVAGG3_0812320 [Trichomonas vaginalis G3]KAI5497304.1 hypothetical protein TVAGG3_0812420 [Trichomonas vaginalis G3]|eukprot:XP_001583550.1 TolA [Trichomonas vaginalis G3]